MDFHILQILTWLSCFLVFEYAILIFLSVSLHFFYVFQVNIHISLPLYNTCWFFFLLPSPQNHFIVCSHKLCWNFSSSPNHSLIWIRWTRVRFWQVFLSHRWYSPWGEEWILTHLSIRIIPGVYNSCSQPEVIFLPLGTSGDVWGHFCLPRCGRWGETGF